MFTYAVASCTPFAMVPPSGDVHAAPVEFLEELFGCVERDHASGRLVRFAGFGDLRHAFEEGASAHRFVGQPCRQVGERARVPFVEARPVVSAQVGVQCVGRVAQVEDERQEFGFIAVIAAFTNSGIVSMGTRPFTPRRAASTPRHAPWGYMRRRIA